MLNICILYDLLLDWSYIQFFLLNFYNCWLFNKLFIRIFIYIFLIFFNMFILLYLYWLRYEFFLLFLFIFLLYFNFLNFLLLILWCITIFILRLRMIISCMNIRFLIILYYCWFRNNLLFNIIVFSEYLLNTHILLYRILTS